MTNTNTSGIYTNRLREIRKSRRISQAKLAKTGGVSRECIRNIENGKSAPSVYLAIVISKTFGMNVEDIFRVSG